jgi:DNA adenine methylase
MSALKAPFPWFGGKRDAAELVWDRFGNLPNYVEPFFGSGAVLLGRPHEPKTETVNDLDGLLCNFWRATATRPEEVAAAADWPVSECDLSARHLELVERRAELTRKLEADPDFSDPLLAGWWVWGQCAWIGSGWCSGEGPWTRGPEGLRKLPHLGNQGQGINRQLPHLGDQGRGINDMMRALASRLRRVRIACGSWERVLGDSVTWRHGLTGVFLDPPYAGGEMDYSASPRGSVAASVAEWAREAGKREDMRIALCGHAGEHVMPGWVEVPWKARGGYGNQGGKDEDDNRHREVVWFSPACGAPSGQRGLFEVSP